jgi:hypothetical protein
MGSYKFVTDWRFDASIAQVWDEIEWNHDTVMRWGFEGLNRRLQGVQ